MRFWERNLATGEIRADDRARQNLGIHESEADVSAVFTNLHPEDVDDVQRSIEYVPTRQEVAALQ